MKEMIFGKSYVSPAMKWGIDNEDKAKRLYEKETGYRVKDYGLVLYEEWGGCSPDGLIGDDGLIEIKCPSKKPHDQTPEHYWIQIQGQLNIMDRKWCDFYSWHPNGTFTERVYRDTKWWSENVGKLKEFWLEWKTHVETEIGAAVGCCGKDRT